MSRLVRFAHLDRLKLRAKLAAAFLCLSLLIGICGASGLVFVYGIGSTLSVFADVTSPLLGQTVGLADNAQRMRSVFLDAISKEDHPTSAAGEALAELDLAAGRGMDKLKQLLDEAKLPVRVGEIRHTQLEFSQGLLTMLAAHTKQRIAALAVQDRLTQFEADRRDFDSLLRTITARGEAVMSETRDQAALHVSAGSATVEGLNELLSNTINEAYPLVQALYKLTRDAVTLQEVANSYINITQPQTLLVIERRTALTFANAREVIDRLASRLRTAEGKGYVARFTAGLNGLQRG